MRKSRAPPTERRASASNPVNTNRSYLSRPRGHCGRMQKRSLLLARRVFLHQGRLAGSLHGDVRRVNFYFVFKRGVFGFQNIKTRGWLRGPSEGRTEMAAPCTGSMNDPAPGPSAE